MASTLTALSDSSIPTYFVAWLLWFSLTTDLLVFYLMCISTKTKSNSGKRTVDTSSNQSDGAILWTGDRRPEVYTTSSSQSGAIDWTSRSQHMGTEDWTRDVGPEFWVEPSASWSWPLSSGLKSWINQGQRTSTLLEPPVSRDWPFNLELESQLD